MEENQFDLGEALGSYEQANADRDFYLSMVQGGTQMASPIAAYLAGVSGVKMATMRQKAQASQDARQAKLDATAAAEKAQKRRDTLIGQLTSIAKGVSDGTIPASVGATLVGPIGKELGINVKQYLPEEGKIVYNEGNDPTDLEWKWDESPYSKQQLQWNKYLLQEQAEERRRKAAEKDAELKQIRIDNLKSGASNKNDSKKIRDFKDANQRMYSAFNPKDFLEQRKSLNDRIADLIKEDKTYYDAWMNGVKELSKEEQEILQPYTNLIARIGSTQLSDVGPVMTSGEVARDLNTDRVNALAAALQRNPNR